MSTTPITSREIPKRRMKETLFTRHRSAVEPMMIAKDRKATLQAIHTKAINQAGNSQGRNVVLDDRPPLINISEKELTRGESMTLAQLRPLAPTRAESVRMLASAFAPTAARHHTMLSISSIAQLISSNDNDTVGLMEQTGGCHPGTHLFRGRSARLR